MSIITREQWGAGTNTAPRISVPVSRLWLHHTVTLEWTGAEAGQKLQRIARQRGFRDISYSWLVDAHGNEIEGRGWGRQGAHTKGYNSSSHAVALVGNFDVNRPPLRMVQGVVNLIRRAAKYGPDRITGGHRDVSDTACPGRYAYSQIGRWNAMALEGPPQEGNTMFFCDRGDQGRAVQYLQLRLRALGFYEGEIDSKYGPKTSDALYRARHAAGSGTKSGDWFNGWAAKQLDKLEAEAK